MYSIADAGIALGSFALDVFLIGDADGNHAVDRLDADLIRTKFGAQQGTPEYAIEADANLDGRITSFDLFQWQTNSSDATDIVPLTLTAATTIAGVSRATAVDDQSITLTGTTSPAATVELDTNADGITDRLTSPAPNGTFSFDLTFPDPGLKTLSLRAVDSFGQHQSQQLTINVGESFRITEVSPANGESLVSTTRDVVLHFNEPINETTNLADAVKLIALGQPLASRLRVSSTGLFATFTPEKPWQGSTEIRIQVDAEKIRAANGDLLDADADGQPGGNTTADFRTVPATLIRNTLVKGRVVASERDAQGKDLPLGNVKIRVDGFPNLYAVTDVNGNFTLGLDPITGDAIGLPSPEYFVHIDGREVTTVGGQPKPAGGGYPNVGKSFPSIPGQTLVKPFDIYLPFIPDYAIHDVTPNQETTIGLPQQQIDEDPSLAMVKLTVPAGSLINDNGDPGQKIGIYRVDSDRLPAPLPFGLNHSFDITVQADVENFDIPAPIEFPNLDGLAPGAKSLLMSFDHPSGEWVVVGTMTAIDRDGDGVAEMVASDPGQGIRAPGWHGMQTGVRHSVTATPAPQPQVPQIRQYEFGFSIVGRLESIPLEAKAIFPVPGQLSSATFEKTFFSSIRPFIFRRTFRFSSTKDYTQFSFPLFNVEAGVTATIGGGLMGEVTVREGDNNADFSWMFNLFPFSASLNVKIDSALPLCNVLPAPLLNLLCINGISFSVSGPGEPPSFDGVSIPVSPTPTADDQFTAGRSFTLTTGFNVPVSIRVFLRDVTPASNSSARPINTASGIASEFEEIALTEEDEPPFSKLSGIGADPTTAYRYVMSDGTEISGRSNLTGEFSSVLAANSTFNLFLYNPSTNTVEIITRETGLAGISLSDSVTLSQVGGPDSDEDGLPDLGEYVLGTNWLTGDTDLDGISDVDEVAQGLNPLDGVGFAVTGLVGSVQVDGEAQAIAVLGSVLEAGGQTSYVATGSYGLAIFDASQFNLPIALGQIDLAGNATDVAVDSNLQIAAVAANSGGLHLVDVSDPMTPEFIRTINVPTGHVEVFQGNAYIADGSSLRTVDLLTGETLQRLPLGSAAITGIAREGTYLYTMDANRNLRAIDLGGVEMLAKGSLQLPDGGGKLFVGNGIAYAADNDERGGFATADVSNPANIVLISGSDVPQFFGEAKAGFAANGSGLGLLVGPVFGTNSLRLFDVSDPSNTNDFRGFYDLPGTARDVAIASGVAYVAGGEGLQVVNYRSFDSNRRPPTVSIASPIPDLDPMTPGRQIIQGVTVPVIATVGDDVQVRNVELIVNGQVMANDVSFPFDLTAIAERASAESPTMTVQVRAIDTGGNATLSNELTYEVGPDLFGPQLEDTNPSDGEVRNRGLRRIEIAFSEPLDTASVTSQTFRLRNISGVEFLPIGVELRSVDTLVELTYNDLPDGEYELVISGQGVTDRAGNSLSNQDIIRSFTLTNIQNSWIGATSGVQSWNIATNWSTGLVPGPLDNVSIVAAGDYTLNLPENVHIGSLTLGGPAGTQIVRTGGGLRLSSASVIHRNGVLELTGGSFVADGELTGAGSVSITGGTISIAGDYRIEGKTTISAANVAFESTAVLGSLQMTSGTLAALAISGSPRLSSGRAARCGGQAGRS